MYFIIQKYKQIEKWKGNWKRNCKGNLPKEKKIEIRCRDEKRGYPGLKKMKKKKNQATANYNRKRKKLQ